ncbi:unnamed protein product [Mesocestoides corti]|uniref:Uncharacterized protein n=1 Tax=Mesocestoides corti TaxID=53468 RepID=A0A0R3URQ7_MESCO|nr:unnamed protein product [Mesocestoides corti]
MDRYASMKFYLTLTVLLLIAFAGVNGLILGFAYQRRYVGCLWYALACSNFVSNVPRQQQCLALPKHLIRHEIRMQDLKAKTKVNWALKELFSFDQVEDAFGEVTSVGTDGNAAVETACGTVCADKLLMP